MTREYTHYPVDVYVDSTGRYHLPIRDTPIIGAPVRYDFGDGVVGHSVTVYRAGHEDDAVVFARAHDTLVEAGYEVREPRGYRATVKEKAAETSPLAVLP